MTEPDDLLQATTVATYKCSTCGNMYPVEEKTCDICGHDCSTDVCQIIKSSNEDF